MSVTSVGNERLNTLISERRKFAAAWESEAQKVVQAVEDHQATINPKRRPYLGPPDSAAQLKASIEMV
jgi:hypothetical protein